MALSKIATIVRNFVRKEATSAEEQLIADLTARNERFSRINQTPTATTTHRARGIFPLLHRVAQGRNIPFPYTVPDQQGG